MGVSPVPTVGQEQVRALLQELQGVVSVSITGLPSDIDYIHVLSTTERSETQILRDVRSALIAHFNIDVALENIRIVMLTDSSLANVRSSRPDLVSVEVSGLDELYEARVTLSHGEQVIKKKVCAEFSDVCSLVAEATLQGVNDALGQRELFFLEGVHEGRIFDRQVVLAAVELRTNRLVRQLLGAAYAVNSGYGASAKAVLDAVNRQFELPF
jgi:hypothetical protein